MSKCYLYDNDNYMFRLSFFSYVQVVKLGIFQYTTDTAFKYEISFT